MTYRTREGIPLRSTDPKELVGELHAMSRSPCASDAEFRREMAGRALLQTGRRVRHGDDGSFVADLVTAGLLIDDSAGDLSPAEDGT